MGKSILGSVVDKLLREETKEQFINKVHISGGMPKDKLTEVYNQGVKFAIRSGKDITTIAKANVYSYVNSTLTEKKEGWVGSGDDDLEYSFEKLFSSYLSLLSDDEYHEAFDMFAKMFTEKDKEASYYGADVFQSKAPDVLYLDVAGPDSSWFFNKNKMIPILKKLIRTVKGLPDSSEEGMQEDGAMDSRGRTEDRLNRGAKAMMVKAVQRGLSSEDLYRQARLADKMGEPQTDALFRAGDMLAQHEKKMFKEESTDADDGRQYALWDDREQKWVSKIVGKKNLSRLRRRRDKLDNEHGAYRYTVREVK
jgi:hypothetical protein